MHDPVCLSEFSLVESTSSVDGDVWWQVVVDATASSMQDVVGRVGAGSDARQRLGARDEARQEAASERVTGADRVHDLRPIYRQHRVPASHTWSLHGRTRCSPSN